MVDLAFGYPMAVAAMGMGFASLATWVWCDVLAMVPPPENITYSFWLTRVVPIGACGGLTLWLGNTMYFYLTVAFIEMSRASMPVLTMIALWVTGMEFPTQQVVAAVSVVAVGSAIAAYGEIALTVFGGLLVIANLSMESARMVMTQFLLVGCNMHPLQSLKLTAPATTLTLVLGSLVCELPDMRSSGAFDIVRQYPLQFLTAATMGLVVNILAVLIIKMSSATTLKVLAAVRGPIVVLFGVMVFSEHVSLLEFFGYSIALVGFVWYQFALSSKPSANPAVGATAAQHHHHHTSAGGAKAAGSEAPLLSGGADVEKGLAGVGGTRVIRTAAGTSGTPSKFME
ncbi:hypothetical protein HYH02_005687 [Chlamydomonas schloesseri]|uniref:Sugar phosphate transporter domain-containing protein n=1 Tax=Chlamydomonas schloesseri TaxID=2026947 RepID=A0A835WLB1_9CHLO|nr:hypothetical protein HYH02_005687 [Chlamydomonas schloesseri]|eukprot:KAG2449545.1 hypothetical protein HYH02_005687 [Chlamydomonas schloesseri]